MVQKSEVEQWLATEPKMQHAIGTLVALLRASQGTITGTDDPKITFVVETEDEKTPELSGKYRITVEALDED